MSSGESVQRWLEKGAEAYAYMRLDEAGQDFQKAVEADPHSAKAQLSLGVIYLFQYQNGVAEQPDLPDDFLDRLKDLPPGSPVPTPTPPLPSGRNANRTAQITQQNSTNGAMAEEHLKKALELEPRHEQAMEYLGLLYFWWRDPATEGWARRDDARQIYTRIAEVNPRHRFATYVCGLIDYEKAFAIIRSTKGFPRPLADEESRRSLRAKVGPLLEDSAANFLRSLEVDPTAAAERQLVGSDLGAMTSLGHVRSDKAYIAESTDESTRLRAEATEWYHKVWKIMEADAKATGQPWPPGDTATITFDRLPGEPPIPPFPPDADFMIPPAAPPPPTSPAAFR
jgi:tetratricopeptide (TPR) repeat protein